AALTLRRTSSMLRSRASVICTALLFVPTVVRSAEPTAEQLEFFEKKIRPVLVQHCYACHSAGAKKLRGKLLLDSRDGIRKGGESGPAIVPGDPAASLLVKALRYQELQMPPAGKLPDSVVADFEMWIKQGAADPREAASNKPRAFDGSAARQFWAFQPPQHHAAPGVRVGDWPRRVIDRFILARLEAAGLRPSPSADRRTWLRRVSFDLVGLPPTPDEIDSLLRDTSPEAEALV